MNTAILSEIIIRKAIKQDASQLLCLFEQHALFEGHSSSTFSSLDASSLKVLGRLQNVDETPITLFVVVHQDHVKGYMSVVKQYSTWDMDYYLYMDCLYLSPELRGSGLGGKLMSYCKNYANEHGVKQIQWQTPLDNANAINFYQNLGAKGKPKVRFLW